MPRHLTHCPGRPCCARSSAKRQRNPDDASTPELGAEITRDTAVIEHAQAKVHFRAAPVATVEHIARATEGLPAGVRMRVEVTVRWPGPLAVGDELQSGADSLGYVDGIVDDGDAAPRLYTARATGPQHIARALPTAWQQMRARSIGAYDPMSNEPVDGEVLREDQLAWLYAAGAHALISEYAAYKSGDRTLGPRVFEALVKLAPIADGWTASTTGRVERTEAELAVVHAASAAASSAFDAPLPGLGPLVAPAVPEAPPPSLPAPANDIFSFFEAPRHAASALDRIASATLFAHAAGLELSLQDHTLRVAVADLGAAPAWSSGAVETDLFSQKLFGPRKDYACECGTYTRMKHRGVVCERCGVEVIAARVRRERSGHVVLSRPVSPRRFPGTWWAVVPVLPPDLRPDAGDPLNHAYEQLLAANAAPEPAALDAAVDAVVEIALARLCAHLVTTPRRSDYSASVMAIVGARCRAPSELLAAMMAPILYGACEITGYTTTIKGAKNLVLRDGAKRDELLAMALHDRVVLVGSSASVMVGVQFAHGDDPIVELDPATASTLGIASGDRVVLHAPISDAGQAEAKRLVAGAAARASDGPSWLRDLAACDRDARVSVLLAAARSSAVDPCIWPPAAVLIGGYPYHGPPAPELVLGARPDPPAPAMQDHLSRFVDELELSVRTANAFHAAGIVTIGDLVHRTEGDLLKISGISRKSLREVTELLAELGLQLGTQTPSA